MKHTILFISLLISICSFAQPQGMNYQGVARDGSGNGLPNRNISLRLSILDSSATGQAVYVETQNATTNNAGLFNLSIGTGAVVSGVFLNIPWGQGDKWLKIEMDAVGGTNYQLIGTSQFLSVPYALYAKVSSGINDSNWDLIDLPHLGKGKLFTLKGSGFWCCGPSFQVPTGKIWRIVSYAGNVCIDNLPGTTSQCGGGGIFPNGDLFVNEGMYVNFSGSCGGGGNVPYLLSYIEYSMNSSFEIISIKDLGFWCCGPSFQVPTGKIWRIVSYAGNICIDNLPGTTSQGGGGGIFPNGDLFVNEGMYVNFSGSGGGGGNVPFYFFAFQLNKLE